MSVHTLIRRCTSAAAVAMVVASAGFGAVFGYRIGIEHSFGLAFLTVLFVVALELLKPVSLASALTCFASWQLVRGVAMTLLGLVAVAYSLIAELALTAQSRGDLAAKRVAETNHIKVNTNIYNSAVEELKTLTARTIPEIEADILKLRAANKNISCEPLGGPVSRYICPQIATLKGEIGRAKRRQELQQTVERHVSNSSSDQVERIADPGSSAIALYLAAMGVATSSTTIGTWLNLVPVLALELGSALSMVLVTAVNGSQNNSVPQSMPHMVPMVRKAPHEAIQIESISARQMRLRREASEKLMNHLMKHGDIHQTERSMGQLFGSDKSTMRRAVLDLASLGVIEHQPSKRGTRIKLAASRRN